MLASVDRKLTDAGSGHLFAGATNGGSGDHRPVDWYQHGNCCSSFATAIGLASTASESMTRRHAVSALIRRFPSTISLIRRDGTALAISRAAQVWRMAMVCLIAGLATSAA